MTPLEEATRRYRTDPEFHRLVDLIAGWYVEQQATPSEVRMAALLAAYKVDMQTVRLMLETPEDIR